MAEAKGDYKRYLKIINTRQPVQFKPFTVIVRIDYLESATGKGFLARGLGSVILSDKRCPIEVFPLCTYISYENLTKPLLIKIDMSQVRVKVQRYLSDSPTETKAGKKE